SSAAPTGWSASATTCSAWCSRATPICGGSSSATTGKGIRCARTTRSTRPRRRTGDTAEESTMIYELRTYTFQPGKQGEYLKLNLEVGRKVRGDKYGKFEGGWTTEFGMLNQ